MAGEGTIQVSVDVPVPVAVPVTATPGVTSAPSVPGTGPLPRTGAGIEGLVLLALVLVLLGAVLVTSIRLRQEQSHA